MSRNNSNSNSNSNSASVRKETYSTSTIIIIVSLLGLVGICIYLYNSYKAFKASLFATNITQSYASCPDYWDTIGKDKCQNVNGLGSCSKINGANTMDFSSEIFTNANTGNYAKCKWAKACNITWGNVDRLC